MRYSERDFRFQIPAAWCGPALSLLLNSLGITTMSDWLEQWRMFFTRKTKPNHKTARNCSRNAL